MSGVIVTGFPDAVVEIRGNKRELTKENKKNLVARILRQNPKNKDVLDRLLLISEGTIVQLSCSSGKRDYEVIGRIKNPFVYDHEYSTTVPGSMSTSSVDYVLYRHIKDFRILEPIW